MLVRYEMTPKAAELYRTRTGEIFPNPTVEANSPTSNIRELLAYCDLRIRHVQSGDREANMIVVIDVKHEHKNLKEYPIHLARSEWAAPKKERRDRIADTRRDREVIDEGTFSNVTRAAEELASAYN